MYLKAKDITFKYGNKKILDKVNFEIETGQRIGIVAPSGFGKTTFARIIAGYEKGYSGTVETDAQRQEGYNPVQLMFQHPERAVNPKWNMERTVNESWQPPKELYDEMGIKDEWLKRYPNELSGGEIQRFCVIRALNPKTKFLIADEMTTMLDAITTAQIWNVVIKRAERGDIGLLVISHEKSMLDYVCTKVVDLSVINKYSK